MTGDGPRRPRRLSGDEFRLWSEVARFVKPLPGRAAPASPHRHEIPATGQPARTDGAGPKPEKPRTTVPPPTALPYQAPVTRPVASEGLERRARRGLLRGTLRIEARIDLHGLRQADAHAALCGFLSGAWSAGHSHVLVVTGKGGAGFDDAFSERGVLKRSVPHWLRSASLSHIVLGFEEAGRHHGGSGALYVRLKRR